MKTKYTQALLNFLDGDEPDGNMMEWVEEQTLIDQPDIMREFKSLVEERLANSGITDFDFDDFDAQIAIYEEAILTEKLAEANLVMANDTLDKTMIEIEETVTGVREYVMDCIVNNEDNAEAMKELAQKMMQSEKENEIFDPKNWSRIL